MAPEPPAGWRRPEAELRWDDDDAGRRSSRPTWVRVTGRVIAFSMLALIVVPLVLSIVELVR